MLEAGRFFAMTVDAFRAINLTAELNNKEGNLAFMTISVLASSGAAPSTGIRQR
jgi:hypothetical protein